MRITGGRDKGRRLALVQGSDIRPTTDQVREAIFNLIGQDLTGLKVLDLFAGTGSLGIEALSRGAIRAMFLDNSIRAVRLIKKNLSLCGYEAKGFVLKKDLIRGFPWKHILVKKKFDLVFIDPPYGKSLIPPLLKELTERGGLVAGSIVVAESSKGESLPEAPGKLQLVKIKIYGDTRINIYNNL